MDYSNIKILLVEDSTSEQRFLQEILGSFGCSVSICSSGEEGWEAFSRSDYQLVLLDWMLPGMDGLELCRRIRTSPKGDRTSIVVITARSEPEDLEEVLEAGADDYISKLAGPMLFNVRLRVALQQALMRIERSRAKDILVQKTEQLAQLNAHLLRDLKAAAQIQTSLLPQALPQSQDALFAYVFRPCEQLGGDMLNLFWLDDKTIGLYMLDVSGHGIEAALFSVILQGILEPRLNHSSLTRQAEPSGVYRIVPPAEVAEKLNEQFRFEADNPRLFTMLYGLLETKSKTLRYVTAGHPGLVYFKNSQAPRELQVPGFPIGAYEKPEYTEQCLSLGPGDRLYLFTDGMIEARNRQEEEYGLGRLIGSIAETASLILEQSIQQILSDLDTFRGVKSQEDDMSILAMEIR